MSEELPSVELIFPVTLVFSNVIEFCPSITSASEFSAFNVAFLTVIFAVEYTAGELYPVEVYVPLSTTTVPPPRSVRIAADEFPAVFTVKLVAFIAAPPVVWIPPELSFVVVIVVSDTLTVVPEP